MTLINKSTRIANQSHSIIDNIHTNSIDENITSGVIIADISDHFPIFSISKQSIHRKEIKTVYRRANNEENTYKINYLLALENWHSDFNVNESYRHKKSNKTWVTNSLKNTCEKEIIYSI